MADGDECREVEAIYDALDRGQAEVAWDLARQALAASPDDPVLRSLAGAALIELDRPDAAVEQLAAAVELDPDDPQFRAQLAQALYRCCRFDEAAEHARAALAADDRLPEAHEIQGLLLESLGRFDEADRHLQRAHELEPDGFPPVRRMRGDEFEAHVREAGDRLPEPFRGHLQQVVVAVEPVPPRAVLLEEDPPLDPSLLGLFVGVPLAERSQFSAGGELPPRIYLFQRNLERGAGDADELREEIAVTLYHELGHYLGLDEQELERIDLA